MRTVMTAACSLALAASLSLATAWANEPATQANAAPAHAAPAAQVNHAVKDPNCIKSTGSRIPPKLGQCVNAPGSVYTQKQLETTGKATVAGALRDLSPSLTISHH